MNDTSSKGIVLIADDCAQELGMLNDALADQGYTIFVAMDGLQALAIAGRMVPDIILMDALMPNMDGFDACRALKKNPDLCDVPVIFMTGLTDTENIITGLESGGVDYITKPVKLDELLARINTHLTNSRLTQSARSALDGIGQLAFACDINGNMIWSTLHARKFMSCLDVSEDCLNQQLTKQIRYWLSHHPEKFSTLTLTGLDKSVQIRFLGQSSPYEYLFKLLDDDEASIRGRLREHFKLTDREAEVLFWLSQGKTNRDIGQILTMSPRTVNKHLESIFRKINVENRTSATALSLQFLNNS